jgi:lipid-A-disaccharide synthase
VTGPNSRDGRPPLVYLIAGELSGDRLGARLMAALKRNSEHDIAFCGVGGSHMAAEGLESLFPIAELSVMGLAEVLPRLPALLSRIRETAGDVLAARPDILVSIDAPDFSLRVAKRLAGRGIPLVHYVAPSVWVWKPGRARKMARYLDHVLTLLPFEPAYFTRHGLAATFVGHPVLESGAGDGDGQAFRRRHHIPTGEVLLCLLPGSRAGEVRRLMPIFKDVLARLMADHPGLTTVMPTVPQMREYLRSEITTWPAPPVIVAGEAEKFDAFAASDAALAASGTVGLELAAARVPHVVAYRFNWLTNKLAHLLVKGDYVHLINVTLGEEAVPEFILENCRAAGITAAVAALLRDKDAARRQTQRFDSALKCLRAEGTAPADAAAKIVLDVIANVKAGSGG